MLVIVIPVFHFATKKQPYSEEHSKIPIYCFLRDILSTVVARFVPVFLLHFVCFRLFHCLIMSNIQA